MSFLKIQSENVCFLTGVFDPLTITVITDMAGAISDVVVLVTVLFFFLSLAMIGSGMVLKIFLPRI